jgi:hypothetical protein
MNQGFRQQPSSSQQSSLHQQQYLQSGSSSEIGEMMKLQKEMFSGRQDSMKVQPELSDNATTNCLYIKFASKSRRERIASSNFFFEKTQKAFVFHFIEKIECLRLHAP